MKSVSKILRNFRRWRRSIWRRLGMKLLDKRLPAPATSLQERLSAPEAKMLFLFTAGKIGDCICSTFVFRELKKAFPNLEIHVLCSRNIVSVLEHCEFVDRVLSMKHPFRIFGQALAALRLRKFRYDLVVARDGDPRTRELLFFRLLGAKEYVGYASFDFKIYSRNFPSSGRNIRDLKSEILRFAGVEKFSDEYNCPRDDAAKKEIAAFLEKEKIEREKFVALNLFGNGENRKISADNALILIRALQNRYAKESWKCLLLGSPKDDAAVELVLKKWNDSGADPEFLNALRPTTSIFQNIELVAAAGLLISPDTSIVHIGDALRSIPMIVFFVPHEKVEALGRQSWMPHDRSTTKCVRYEDDVNEIDFSKLPL